MVSKRRMGGINIGWSDHACEHFTKLYAILELHLLSHRFTYYSYQSFYTCLYCRQHLCIFRHFLTCEYEKHMQCHALWQYIYKQLFIQSPGLYHEPAHTMSVYRTTEFLFRNRKTGFQPGIGDWGLGIRDSMLLIVNCQLLTANCKLRIVYCQLRTVIWFIYNIVYDTYGKNRKRFPVKEKRVNMLLSFEPLINLESITNGK